ncbi:methyl-CpG-binding domain-containing protein 5-like isoform X3 [Alnus glutinosa]|uniref:methyl-CpG-binding domain-containing protein 5-like isoform X3 n=1 Tax=Alnus glutinosa TaxID=3517 RepID=UPI002D764B6A|nr:methyl-CpG-binding domain-containing protein 5-like isoform X3 [Alnus glutinosa]
MSTAETSGQDLNPNFNSPKRGPNRPDETLAADLPSDPLLDFDSFIDATATATGGHRTPEKLRMHRSSSSASAFLASENSNGAEQNAASPAGAQPRRAPAASPDWLPSGWSIEDRVRSSGATAGTVDRYYFDPVSGIRFRSKTEVLYFLETGTKRKKKKLMENSDADTMGSGGQKQKKSATKAKSSVLKFDFLNVPEKVNWVFTDSSQGSWAPFIGDKKVSESIKQEWATAFTVLTSRQDSQKMF